MNFLDSHPKQKALSLFLTLSSLILLLLSLYTTSHQSFHFHHSHLISTSSTCSGIHRFHDFKSKCVYAKTHPSCRGHAYLSYYEIFYCTGQLHHALGYLVLILLIMVLFYLLGHTASEYFCPSVESLSAVLNLPPTIAGTTLLPFGNGANDVFSSIISFTRSGNADVGLNSVLGGAFFICCVVVGIVSISVSSRGVMVDGPSFVRDVLFFLFVLCCLLVIILFGWINFWFSLCFASLYLIYIVLVTLMQIFRDDHNEENTVAKPIVEDEFSAVERIPLLGYADEENRNMSANDSLKTDRIQESGRVNKKPWWQILLCIVRLPLDLPRMLTIPVVGEQNWSKPLAIMSSTLVPIVLATLYMSQSKTVLCAAVLVGLIFGALTVLFTTASTPPKGLFQLPYLAIGFLMSIVWTYVTAEELVDLLVTFGDILEINPAILGFTVLAWGNSLGDLISDVTLAVKGGPDGAQVAVSGCYAGSLFNTLVGLGVSMVMATWEDYPSGHEIPSNAEVLETVGFLIGALVWALVVLPKRNMQLDRWLGVGLLIIYFCFLFLRLVKSVGLLQIGGLEFTCFL